MKATLSSNNKANQEVFMLFRALLFEEMCGDYAKLQWAHSAVCLQNRLLHTTPRASRPNLFVSFVCLGHDMCVGGRYISTWGFSVKGRY